MNHSAGIPFVTVILPVRNEASSIIASLDSVLHQDYPQERMEILIADGMSTDGTRAIVQEYQNRFGNIFLVDNPGKIVPTGMNLALRRAKGEFIVRVDGHCVIESNYINLCVKYLTTNDVDGVGGPMQSIGDSLIAKSIAIAMSSMFGVGNSAFRTITGKTMLVDTIPFPAYTSSIIKKAGLYDEELVRNQDDEYNYRIRNLGGKLLLVKDICSRYYSRGSFLKLWKQYYQYGFYKVRVLQKHPRQMSLRQFIPPLFVLSLMVASACSLIFSRGWIILTSLIGIYLLANLGASLITSISKGLRFFPLLPLTYAILHLSYGLGFLAGLVRFWNRWSDKEGKVPIIG